MHFLPFGFQHLSGFQWAKCGALACDAIFEDAWRSKLEFRKNPWGAPRLAGRGQGGLASAALPQHTDVDAADIFGPVVVRENETFVVLQLTKPMS